MTMRPIDFIQGRRYRHSNGDVIVATWRTITAALDVIVGVYVDGSAVGSFVYANDGDWYAEVGE